MFILLLTISSINLKGEVYAYRYMTSKIEKLKASIWNKVGSKIKQKIQQMNKITKNSDVSEFSDSFQNGLSTVKDIRKIKKAEIKSIEKKCFGVQIPHVSKEKEEEYNNNWNKYRELEKEFKTFKFDFWRSLFRGTIQARFSEWIW